MGRKHTADFDVIVVGASLAGSSLTTFFNNHCPDCRVALVDKEAFPRRKPCGEGLSLSAVSTLHGLGLSVSNLPHVTLGGYRIRSGGRSVSLSSHDACYSMGVGIQRTVLDTALFQLATRSSMVEPLLCSKVTSVEVGRSQVDLLVNGKRISGRTLVIADGSSSLLSKRLRIPERNSGKLRYGASVICRSSSHISEVNVISRRGYEIYVTPVDEGLFNVSVLASQEAIRQLHKRKFLPTVFSDIEDECDSEFRAESEVLGVGPTFPSRRTCSFGRALLVGDAAEALDPVSGMGMTLALRSGVLGARALIDLFNEKQTFAQVAETYARRHMEVARPLRGYTRMAYLLISRWRNLDFLALAERSGLAWSMRNVALNSVGRSTKSLSRTLLNFAGGK